ncbi:glycosyltransferase [Marinicella sp. W31]|uniref:glycosyltransferase n=1 Tax=Marinicella sp. W31 TaxID=3023713 RepID=UPI0037580D23
MFEIRGGGERMMLTLVNALDADLMFAYHNPNSFDLKQVRGKLINLGLGKTLPGLRTFKLARLFSELKHDLDGYENIIYSGVAAPLAVRHQTHGKSIFYCHTPPRFVYDQKDYYMRQQSWPGRMALRLLNRWFKPRYEKAVAQIQILLTNSKHVAERIEHYLGRTAQVVHPPCDVDRFSYMATEPYYLSTGRLDGLKRVNAIIEAFKRMPNKKLVVASGGGDLEKLRQQAQGATNIEFTGWIEEQELQQLMGRCAATIYIPKDEDFGISPVESMAAGKPVFCSNHGGLLETVVDGVTGFYINDAAIVDHLIETIEGHDMTELAAMRGACEARAQLFAADKAIEAFKKLLDV